MDRQIDKHPHRQADKSQTDIAEKYHPTLRCAVAAAAAAIDVTHHGPAPTTARAIGHFVAREPLFRGIQLLGPQ